MDKLHRIVPGRGGLHDLPLKPSQEIDSAAAHMQLGTLAGQLYDLTR
jgi:hypothetical protein